MRQVTVKGLDFAPEAKARYAIQPLRNAPASLATVLVDEWGQKTAAEAHDVLKQPDVKVTNQSDKDMQLPKLLALNDFAKRVVAEDKAVTA